jgi:hypothetical protein
MAMSATEGFAPSSVVRLERCVLSDDRRSADFAASSEDEAMCEAVMTHWLSSAFSASL